MLVSPGRQPGDAGNRAAIVDRDRRPMLEQAALPHALAVATAAPYAEPGGFKPAIAEGDRKMRKLKAQIVVVGGFLGAGKTSLLWEAAKRIIVQGRSVALITNDQAPHLVDTEFLSRKGLTVEEVAGSCFCCDFFGLTRAARNLVKKHAAEVILAEPVGSCTDLSATILQPIKDRLDQEFVVGPMSVLTDPLRLREFLAEYQTAAGFYGNYIYTKQLQEADILVLNKSDLLSGEELSELTELAQGAFPGVPILPISTMTGEGVDSWLQVVLQGRQGGANLAEVDYDRYAQEEAAFGWLNAVIRLRARQKRGAPDWKTACAEYLLHMKEACRERNLQIGHIKLLLTAGTDEIAGNLTHVQSEVSVRGELSKPGRRARLILNARVKSSPDFIRSVVTRAPSALERYDITFRIAKWNELVPGRPQPTHRYSQVVTPD